MPNSRHFFHIFWKGFLGLPPRDILLFLFVTEENKVNSHSFRIGPELKYANNYLQIFLPVVWLLSNLLALLKIKITKIGMQ